MHHLKHRVRKVEERRARVQALARPGAARFSRRNPRPAARRVGQAGKGREAHKEDYVSALDGAPDLRRKRPRARSDAAPARLKEGALGADG